MTHPSPTAEELKRLCEETIRDLGDRSPFSQFNKHVVVARALKARLEAEAQLATRLPDREAALLYQLRALAITTEKSGIKDGQLWRIRHCALCASRWLAGEEKHDPSCLLSGAATPAPTAGEVTVKCHTCDGKGHVPGDPEAAPIETCQKCEGAGHIKLTHMLTRIVFLLNNLNTMGCDHFSALRRTLFNDLNKFIDGLEAKSPPQGAEE